MNNIICFMNNIICFMQKAGGFKLPLISLTTYRKNV